MVLLTEIAVWSIFFPINGITALKETQFKSFFMNPDCVTIFGDFVSAIAMIFWICFFK